MSFSKNISNVLGNLKMRRRRSLEVIRGHQGHQGRFQKIFFENISNVLSNLKIRPRRSLRSFEAVL